MNTLDSRFLQYGGTFTQMFPKAAKIAYSVAAGGGRLAFSSDSPQVLEVSEPAKAAKGAMTPRHKQHMIGVSRQGRAFGLDSANLQIEAGDSVT
jgi:hypothetical protein